MLRLVPIDDVNPSAYNPRTADPVRLDILELSIRKLGFVLPIFASSNGEILSGHQRHHVAKRMGLEAIPVYFTGQMDLPDRKAINIAFNRGTNDLSVSDTPKNITEALNRINLDELVKSVSDKPLEQLYRCMSPTVVSVKKLTKVNKGKWVNYARNMARMLYGKKIIMPIVCTRDNRVVNGIGRLQYAAEKGWSAIEVIYIDDNEARLSDAMLNLLSMDFDIHSRYEDLLRYNSFRRGRRVRGNQLGLGFIFSVAPMKTSKEYDVTKPDNSRKWKRFHGRSVVDFGAGHLTETEVLRSIGVNVTPFEPFHLGMHDQIDKLKSIELAKSFLRDISSGKTFTSVFISSVLNSVPFALDRRYIACLCAALCSDKTRLYACASASGHPNIKVAQGMDGLSERQSKCAVFKLDYEDGITIGDFKEKPKVQKYHSPEEFYRLFKRYFSAVEVVVRHDNVNATCGNPIIQSILRDLRAAIEFEFNLPYPDGSRMNLVDEAISAYETRLGVTL